MNPKSNRIPMQDSKHLTKLKALLPNTTSPRPKESIISYKRENKLPAKSRKTSLILKPTVDLRR